MITKIVYSSRLFPNIWAYSNPMKILEFQTMVGLAGFSGDDVVLDLGCGNGLQTCCLAKMAKRVVGVDIGDMSKAEDKARRVASKVNVQFLQSRLQDAPFSDEMFDKVFSFCVIGGFFLLKNNFVRRQRNS